MRARSHLVVIAVFALLAILSTYPLIARFSTHVIGDSKLDNYEYVWKMWWFPHALTSGLSPFTIPTVYFPYGYALAYGEITPIHTVFMTPFTLLFGEIVSYNLSVIGSTVLTGWLTFLLARRWYLRLEGEFAPRLITLAALFAGAAFAFSLYRQHRLAGHLPLLDTQWLALSIFAFDRWLAQRRLRDAALTAAAVSLSALSSWYYAFMLLLLLPVYAAAYGLNWRGLLTDGRTWRSLVIAAAIVGVLCLPFLLPYLQVAGEGAATIPVEDAAFWAASPTDYLVPNPLHPLWGALVRPVIWPFPSPMITEFLTSIGLATLVLALYGSRRTRGKSWRALKWLIAAAFVLSLGPYLSLSRLPLGIPLPDLLLREALPAADGIRSWGRFSVFVMLGFSLLGGAGLLLAVGSAGARLPGRRAQIAAVGVAALMLFESWTGATPTVRVEPRPVDLWLAEQPSAAPIMEFPLSAALSGPGMYYTRFHGKPVTYGYGTYLPLLYVERHPALLGFPDDASIDQLVEWGVHYVLVTTDALDYETFTPADVAAQPRLEFVIRLGEVEVYVIR
ncbi:MAG: hypothetical protein JNL42_17465 [Anaerolineae bacterium]|nr:hypothetical protein [Anaerolineae bacterium]